MSEDLISLMFTHCNKFLLDNPFFLNLGIEPRYQIYGKDAITGKLSDEELIFRLSKMFTLKPVTMDELQRRTYFNEMIMGPRHPDVYTMLWEIEEDERSAVFYDMRRATYSPEEFEEIGRIVLFYSPTHPLDGELPVSHFASNEPSFQCFADYYQGIEPESLLKLDNKAWVYLGAIMCLDEALTRNFGYGKRVKLAELPFEDERIPESCLE